MTPFPSTPLDRRLLKAGRLGWAKHLLDSDLFTMAFTPENITQAQAEAELRDASTRAYSSKPADALKRISDRRLSERIVLFFARLAFRGICFPQMTVRQRGLLLLKNRRPLLSFCYEGLRPEWTCRSLSVAQQGGDKE